MSSHASSLVSPVRGQRADRLNATIRHGALALALAALAACGGGGSAPSSTPPETSGYTPTPTPAPQTDQASVTQLHVFNGPSDGAEPNGPLLIASDGNFYGTTTAGGANECTQPFTISCGTVFKMTPDGEVSTFYSFGASATDGSWPTGPLVQGSDGALYGTTVIGGQYGKGSVFKITLGGVYTLLHSFGASADDGITPMGGLIQASDGYFYGTTSSGGANQCVQIPSSGNNCGTIFKMSSTGVTTILYSFGASVSDGVEPNPGLLEGPDGNLYGTTGNGGAGTFSLSLPPETDLHNCGVVYKITPAGAMTILHSFCERPGDAMAAQGPLILGSDGAFYGTTASGGTLNSPFCYSDVSCGTVFRVTSDGNFSVLYSFGATERNEGSGPSPWLIQASDGNFYGTTNSGGIRGGPSSGGTVFRVTSAGVMTMLYSFDEDGASDPNGGLIQGQDGAFYGITFYSDPFLGAGTLFRLVPN